MDFTRFSLVLGSPWAAHSLKSGRGDSPSGSFTVSIIWPCRPSAKTTAGVRHLAAISNALTVKSHISCALAGASVNVW